MGAITKKLIVPVLLATIGGTSLVVTAHGGGLDKCGGHKNKKAGGYHVHNKAKYCACNPRAAECLSPDAKSAPKKK